MRVSSLVVAVVSLSVSSSASSDDRPVSVVRPATFVAPTTAEGLGVVAALPAIQRRATAQKPQQDKLMPILLADPQFVSLRRELEAIAKLKNGAEIQKRGEALAPRLRPVRAAALAKAGLSAKDILDAEPPPAPEPALPPAPPSAKPPVTTHVGQLNTLPLIGHSVPCPSASFDWHFGYEQGLATVLATMAGPGDCATIRAGMGGAAVRPGGANRVRVSAKLHVTMVGVTITSGFHSRVEARGGMRIKIRSAGQIDQQSITFAYCPEKVIGVTRSTDVYNAVAKTQVLEIACTVDIPVTGYFIDFTPYVEVTVEADGAGIAMGTATMLKQSSVDATFYF